MSREPIDVNCCVHAETAGAVRVSDTGEDVDGVWIPRSQMASYHLTGKTTKGTDCFGQSCFLPIAAISLPEWKAKQAGLI